MSTLGTLATQLKGKPKSQISHTARLELKKNAVDPRYEEENGQSESSEEVEDDGLRDSFDDLNDGPLLSTTGRAQSLLHAAGKGAKPSAPR